MAITFPEEVPNPTTAQGVDTVGGAEKYNKIDGTYISVLNVGSASITSLNADVITTGTLAAARMDAAYVYAGTINASQITAGTMVADRISGGSLVIGGNADALGVIVIKNSSGTEITRMNNSGIIVRNTRGLFFESSAGGDYFTLSNNASSQAILRMPNSDQLFIVDSAGTTNLFTFSSSKAFSEKEFWINNNLKFGNGSSLSEHSLEGVDIVKGYNDLRFQVASSGGGNQYFRFLDSGGNVVCYIDAGDGTFHTGSI